MMKNEKCYIIKDLLPSYIDEICTDETNEISRRMPRLQKKLQSYEG